MYHAILRAIAALSVFGISATPAMADDNSTCAGGKGDDAVAACSRLIERNPGDMIAYNNRGAAYISKGDFDRAIADLDVVTRVAPNAAMAYYNRGNAYNRKGDFDRAITDYGHAIRLDPQFEAAYNNRGTAYSSKGDFDRAIADHDHAIRLKPSYAAYLNRGVAYSSKGDSDRAIADYDQAIGLNPNEAIVYLRRGQIYHVKGELDRAIADYDQAVRLDPNFFPTYFLRSAAYFIGGEYDRAIADYDELIRRFPTDANTYFNRGNAYSRKGDDNRAIADYDQAIRLNPTDANTYFDRGNAYNRKRDYNRAIADLDQAVRLDPKNAVAYNSRGEAYEAKNDPDHALADYEQSLKLNPTLAKARQGRERARTLLARRSNPGQPAKRALVIGINVYPNLGSAAQLERAVADAEAVGDKLASLGFQVTRLTTAPQTTLDAIIHGFDDFQKTITPNDMVVLFYAGHGMGLSDGTYLVPADVREASLEVGATAKRAAINENELTDGLRQAARNGIVVAVIDACRNDLFSRATRRALGERGLRPAETEGIFKIYSASEGQTALDRLPGSDGSRNSVFTRVFLNAISTPGLNLNTLGATVRDEVHELARSADHEQTPAVYDKLIGSTRVYFAGETAAARR